MNTEEFRIHAKEVIDYICEFMLKIRERPACPDVKPGYMRPLLPKEAPKEPETWDKIMKDVEPIIMKGAMQWNHPNFHAYFNQGNSFPSVLGDMLITSLGTIGFSWESNPASTELETIVMNWLAKALNLPSFFIFGSDSPGAGITLPTTSDCILAVLIAARNRAIEYLKVEKKLKLDDADLVSHIVAYCCTTAHSCVEKAAQLLLVKIRLLKPDENCSLRGETFKKAIEKDKAEGLLPFFLSAICGSTGCTSFDNFEELGMICQEEPCIWFHVDGAYGACAFICPELRYLAKGVEYASSLNLNPYKFLMVTLCGSCLWVKDKKAFAKTFSADPVYMKNQLSDAFIDFRHYGIQLSRPFRSLKLWFVLRSYGITGLQKHIRNLIGLAKHFESLVLQDDRFELIHKSVLGLVCFRLKKSNHVNRALIAAINDSRKIHLTPAEDQGRFIIRMCVVYEQTKKEDIDYSWSVIRDYAEKILDDLVPFPGMKEFDKHSFSVTVTDDVYKKYLKKKSLIDTATPIVIPNSAMHEISSKRKE